MMYSLVRESSIVATPSSCPRSTPATSAPQVGASTTPGLNASTSRLTSWSCSRGSRVSRHCRRDRQDCRARGLRHRRRARLEDAPRAERDSPCSRCSSASSSHSRSARSLSEAEASCVPAAATQGLRQLELWRVAVEQHSSTKTTASNALCGFWSSGVSAFIRPGRAASERRPLRPSLARATCVGPVREEIVYLGAPEAALPSGRVGHQLDHPIGQPFALAQHEHMVRQCPTTTPTRARRAEHASHRSEMLTVETD